MKKRVLCVLLFVAVMLSTSAFAFAGYGLSGGVKGDLNGDGQVDVSDALLALRIAAGLADAGELTDAADVDGNGQVDVSDALSILRVAAGLDYFNDLYSLNAALLDGTPGVYEVKAVKGDSMDGENGKTIGIPSVANQTLAKRPTEEAPAIIMGAANGFETKTGPVQYTMNDGLTEDDITAPYKYFRHKIITETITDADGNTSTHDKLSGFDGTYYIIRVDVSDIIEGKSGYLHIKQESNKALMVMVGMQGGVSTGEIGLNADGTQTEAPHIDAGTNRWFVGEKDTGIEVGNETASLSYVDTDGIWCVSATGFSDGMGMMTQAISLADGGKALMDDDGNYTAKPYVNVILMSSGKLAAGADAGTANAVSSDVKLSMYVDDTRDYDTALVYDPASQDVNHVANVMAKFFKAEACTAENDATSYLVKGSDLEIDVVTANKKGNEDVLEYWSLTKAISYPKYDSHVIKLICEVPVLEGLTIEGTADNQRSVVLDVNSFDIQVANHASTNSAGLCVKDHATLTITDDSRTSGAELAIGNNASMEIESGGTLIISESCQLEVEYDAATITQTAEGEQPQGNTTPLSNGVITVHSGGKIVNNGVINIEGLEVKPIQTNGQEQQQQETVTTDMKSSCIPIEDGAVVDNYGCISLKGNLYVLGTINNYGRYDDVIEAQDPDKGNISYHKGIQLTWKDNVTVLDEQTNTYSVNPDIIPGTLFIGKDGEGNICRNAKINNYGDIVLVPGVMNIHAEFGNLTNEVGDYAGHLYICAVTEAVVPIVPDPADPTKTEERRPLSAPYNSSINYFGMTLFRNEGVIAEASVEVLSNGVLGNLTVKTEA